MNGNALHAWALTVVLLLAAASPSWAQPAVGSGPLTSALADAEPTVGVLELGFLKLAPGIQVREIGYDWNVFDDAEDPKEDFVAAATPDVAAYLRLRFVRLSGYGGIEFVYYDTYESERSRGHIGRGRVDLLLSRLRPFVAGASLKTRTRPNGEIDVRADRRENEVSGGVAFDWSPTGVIYGAASRLTTEFVGAFEDGVSLDQSLNRDAYDYSLGVRTDLTPLTSLTIQGALRQDRFVSEPLRNSDTGSALATLTFAPQAVVNGTATVGYRYMDAVDPLVEPYRGLTVQAGIGYALLEQGRFNFGVNYGFDYSFDVQEAYYVETTVTLGYTQRLFGEFDAHVRGAHSTFDYGHREGSSPHVDELDVAATGLGYNLRNRTRIALNYEFARRRSPEIADRNYNRHRVFLSWTYAF